MSTSGFSLDNGYRRRQGQVQASFVIAIERPLKQAIAAPLVDGRRGNAQMCRQFAAGDIALGTQPLEATLEVVGLAHQDNLLGSEWLAGMSS